MTNPKLKKKKDQKQTLSAPVTEKSAKPVGLQRLHEWLGTNAHLTWYMGKYPKRCKDDRNIGAIKYLVPQFDTRTHDIYNISTRGWSNYTVDFREEFDGDILDLLKYKIENELYNKEEEEND
jgi:hypothetical protein